MPENSIEGFLKAIDLGVDAIELDLVVTKDMELLVAHDPWFEPKICDTSSSVNKFYELDLKAIQQEPFGMTPVLDFPQQEKVPVIRPTLTEVIKACFNHKPTIGPGFFVIEVKSQADWYNIYQPPVEVYAELVDNAIASLDIATNCMVQSFDHNFLNAFHGRRQDIPLGLLVEDAFPLFGHLALLDFKPAYYNPEHPLITMELLDKLKAFEIACYTWTVNDKARQHTLIEMGVQGIITDYP